MAANESPIQSVATRSFDSYESDKSKSTSQTRDHQIPFRRGEAAIETQYLLPYQPFKCEEVVKKDDLLKNATQASNENLNKNEDKPPRKKHQRDMNKNRPRNPNPLAKDKLFLQFLDGKCKFGDKCYYSHDLQILIKHRQPDIPGKCRNFELYGNCPYSITCRFGKQHVTEDFINVTTESFNISCNDQIMNILGKSLQVKLRKKQFLFPKFDDSIKQIKESKVQSQDRDQTVKTLGAFTNKNVMYIKQAENRNFIFSSEFLHIQLVTK